MAYCCELKSGCCGCPIRNLVCSALCHYVVFGIFSCCFVFTNSNYPPFYLPDYLYGGSAAALILMSFLTGAVVDSKKCQCLRGFFALLTVLNVLLVVSATYYYTIVRWNDVAVTLITVAFRSPPTRDFPDYVWFTLSVTACVSGAIFLYYLIFIISFLCNPYKSYLFLATYENNQDFSALPPILTITDDRYSQRAYKPYPVQPENNTNTDSRTTDTRYAQRN